MNTVVTTALLPLFNTSECQTKWGVMQKNKARSFSILMHGSRFIVNWGPERFCWKVKFVIPDRFRVGENKQRTKGDESEKRWALEQQAGSSEASRRRAWQLSAKPLLWMLSRDTPHYDTPRFCRAAGPVQHNAKVERVRTNTHAHAFSFSTDTPPFGEFSVIVFQTRDTFAVGRHEENSNFI